MVALDDMELVGKMAVKGPQDYRKQVKSLLAAIKAKTVGRLLVDTAVPGKIFIIPDPLGETCYSEVPYYDTPGGKCKLITDISTIEFSPGCKDPAWPDDETLFHELVHAIRMSRGIRDCEKLPAGLSKYDTREEFYTILLTNIYTSEKHPGSLAESELLFLNDHRGGRMKKGDAASFLMEPANLELVEAFMKSMPELSKQIALVKTPFNAIRDVYLYALACVAGF